MSTWDDKPNDYEHACKLAEAYFDEIIVLQADMRAREAEITKLTVIRDEQNQMIYVRDTEIARLKQTLIDVQSYATKREARLRAALEEAYEELLGVPGEAAETARTMIRKALAKEGE